MDLEDLDNLIRRCQRGEPEALEAVFVEYQPRLTFYLRRLVSSMDQIDDLMQDIWIKVIRKVKSLRDPRAFTAWVYRIARNEVYSKTRLKHPCAGGLDQALDELPAEDTTDFTAYDMAHLYQGLDRLKAPQKEILTLLFFSALLKNLWVKNLSFLVLCFFYASRDREIVSIQPHRLQAARFLPVASLGVMPLASLAFDADPSR